MAISRSPHKTFDKKREAMAAKAAEIRAGEQAAKARSALGPGEGGSLIYGLNAVGDRAAYILPDVTSISAFVADPEGVNINGSKAAKLIYQARYSSDPTIYGNSRVGAWLSFNWNPLTGTPAAKASRYSLYLTFTSEASDPNFPQEASGIVSKGVQKAGCEHGKLETAIFVAAHERVATSTTEEAHGLLDEDGFGILAETGDALLEEDGGTSYQYVNGKLVCVQSVLVFDGPDIGWNHDPETDDDDGDGTPDSDAEASTPRTAYPGYGVACNNAGLTGGYAAFIAKARKPDSGGVPWLHGFHVSKRGVSAFPFRHQRYFGVCAIGFDPSDGLGPRAMPFLGVGIDAARAPLHLKGPVTLDQRAEYTGSGAAAYTLAKWSFRGKTTVGTTTYDMGEIRLDVTDPTRGSECSAVTIRTVQDGDVADVLHVGRGLYMEGLDDQGPQTINVTGLFINNVLFAGTDPDAALPVTPISVQQTGKGMVIKATGPDDRRFAGIVIYRSAVADPTTATEIAFVAGRRLKKLKYTDTDALIFGTTYTYYGASVSRVDDSESTVRTLLGADVYSDALPVGQALTLASGQPAAIAAQPTFFYMADGDVAAFPVDYGTPPRALALDVGLPALSGSDVRSLQLDITSTQMTASFNTVTPGVETAKNTSGSSSLDATLPTAFGSYGHSIVKGDAALAYDQRYTVTAHFAWGSGNKGRAQQFFLYYKLSGVWHSAQSFYVTVPSNASNADYVVAVDLVTSANLTATDAFAVWTIPFGSAVIALKSSGAISVVNWTERTDAAPSPVTTPIPVLVFPNS